MLVMCHAKRLGCYLQGHGHSVGSKTGGSTLVWTLIGVAANNLDIIEVAGNNLEIVQVEGNNFDIN